MKHSLLFIVLVAYFTDMPAQSINTVDGVYQLSGVMETASGFKLNKDSTFEFYFSIGALDRYGSGSYRMQNKQIIFNSKPPIGNDFKIADSTLTESSTTTIRIKDDNPAFYQFVYCLFKTSSGDTMISADEEGLITLPMKTDKIVLFFELSPERTSTFIVDSSKANSYTFNFQPWIVEVFFKDFSLLHEPKQLTGKHPLLKDGKYAYLKEQ